MLSSLKFVQGAVAAKDFVPELCHFRIENGTIRGYNGMLGLCSPIDLDLDVSPKAVPFIKAIQTCKNETVQLHMTPGGKLSVKSGKFKALIDCLPENDFPDTAPTGAETQLNGGLLGILKVLAPFIAEDASKPWARGILFKGQSAFATNNICLVEHWLTSPFPVEVNIPRSAVMELIRIGEEPEKIQVTENRVTFHYSGNRWLSTQTYSSQWPDLSRILDVESVQREVPSELWEAVENLIPFVDDLGKIIFKENGIVATHEKDEEGAAVEVPGFGSLTSAGCFHFKQLSLLSKIVETIDFTAYPRPCIFYGDAVRGAIIGFRE